MSMTDSCPETRTDTKLAPNTVTARPRSAPTLPTGTRNVTGSRRAGTDPTLAPTAMNFRPNPVPTEVSLPMNVPVSTRDVPSGSSPDPNLAPSKSVPATKHLMHMHPPYAHYGPPQANGQHGWTYGWAPYASPYALPHDYGRPKPHDYLPGHAPNSNSKDDFSEYKSAADEATLESDDESVSSNSTAGGVETVCVTQNGGLLLKSAKGFPLALIDSDTANVASLFRSHKIQVTNLTTSGAGHNAVNTLNSLATVAPVKNDHRKYQRWTEDEDDLLRSAIDKSGPAPYNWKRISRKYFRGIRTSVQCKNRWLKVLQPGLKRSPWTDAEDTIVCHQKELGKSWSEIAQLLPGRIGEQVRERWMSCLDPSIKKTPWTDEENEILFKAQARLGNKWVEISKLLPGRSENAVKNRWHNAKTSQRRKIKQLAKEAETRARLDEARRGGSA